MTVKHLKLALISFASLCLLSSPSFALSTQSVPTNAQGAAFTDPDAKFDNMGDQPQQGAHTMDFGNSSISLGMQNSDGQSTGVQTGKQLFDSGWDFNKGR
jgi:hypothetical protein